MHRWIVVLVLLLSAAAARLAHADGPAVDQAKRAFEEGVDLEKRADYPSALAKFRAAEQIKPTAGLRFHIAYCLEMLGNLASAVDAYESAEKLAREQGKTEVETAARTRVDPLRARVPEVTIKMTEGIKTAHIEMDGHAVLADTPLHLDPGEHVVKAQAQGREPFMRRVVLTEGSKTIVEIAFAPLATGTTPSTTPPPIEDTPPPAEPQKRSRTLAIATTAGAVALLAIGITTFLLAGSAADDARNECPRKTTCDSERSTVRTLDTIAVFGIAGGLVLGGFSVYLWTAPNASTVAVGGAF